MQNPQFESPTLAMPTRLSNLTVVSVFLLGAATAFAQTAPVVTPVTTQAAEEAIVLSPFEVNAGDDRGYQAGNTTSGSRLNAKLKDTPAPISPFTPEFLADFALTNIEEIMGYSANFEKDFEDSNAGFNSPSSRTSAAATPPFRVRGLIGAFAVDLVESAVPQDTYNIDRVEVSSGPNSVLFGLGAAGGTVSLTSKQANVNRTRTTLRTTVGSWDFFRAEADHNQVLIKNKLALRVNGLFLDREGWRSYDFEKSRRLAAAVTLRPWKNTTLRAAWDGGNYAKHTDWPWTAGDGVTLWTASNKPLVDGATAATDATNALLGLQRFNAARWTFFDNNRSTHNLQNEVQSNLPGDARLLSPALMPYDFGWSGPGSRLRGSIRNYSVKFDQKIGDSLVIEGAYIHTFNFAQANGWAVPGNMITLRGDGNITTPLPAGGTVANPFAGQLFLDNNWRPDDTAFQNDVVRLSAAYEFNLGKWGRHRFACLLETGKIDQTRHVYTEILVNQAGVPINNAATPEGANNQLFRRHYVTPGDFESYYQSTPDIAVPAFTVGANTFSPRYVALNQNGSARDQKLTDTMMLATQNYWLKDRLITTLGYRSDKVVFKNGNTARLTATDPRVLAGEGIVNEFAMVPGSYVKTPFKPRTFTAGAVLHATSRFSVFYNQSDNVGAPVFNARIIPPSTPPTFVLPDMTDGKSKDYGLMIDLLGDDRFFLRATKFDSAYIGSTPVNPGNNPFQPAQALGLGLNALVAAGRLSAADADKWRVDPSHFSVDVISQGYEAEIIANPSKNFTLRASYSYSDRNRDNFFGERNPYVPNLKAFLATVNTAGVVTAGATPLTIPEVIQAIDDFIADTGENQEQPFASRPHKFTLNGRYNFTEGAFKGLAIGGAVRFQSRNYMQKDLRETIGTAPNPDYGREYYGRNFENWDFFTTYRTKLPLTKANLVLQVNVRNAFNQARVQPARFINDFSALRRVYLNEPRSLRFTATVEF